MLTIHTSSPALVLSAHAVDRYQQRVDRGASRTEAKLALGRIAGMGRTSERSRHWMRSCALWPGTRCLYWAQRPDVCLLIRDDVVVTVLTREMFRSAGEQRPVKRPARRLEPVTRWRWRGDLEEAA